MKNVAIQYYCDDDDVYVRPKKRGAREPRPKKSGARKPHLSISHFDKNKDQKVVTYKRHFPIDGNIFPKKRVTMPNLENRGVGHETISVFLSFLSSTASCVAIFFFIMNKRNGQAKFNAKH
jgi:hypothetical protein